MTCGPVSLPSSCGLRLSIAASHAADAVASLVHQIYGANRVKYSQGTNASRGQQQLQQREARDTRHTTLINTPSNFSETTMTLKCDSAPAGALCIPLSLITSRWHGSSSARSLSSINAWRDIQRATYVLRVERQASNEKSRVSLFFLEA